MVRQGLKAVLEMCRLGGLAETDLVRHHHAVTIGQQFDDGALPVGTGKILAVQKQHRFSIALFRRHIHVGHFQILLLIVQAQRLHRGGIRETRQTDIKGQRGSDQASGQQQSRQHQPQWLYFHGALLIRRCQVFMVRVLLPHRGSRPTRIMARGPLNNFLRPGPATAVPPADLPRRSPPGTARPRKPPRYR